MRLPVLFKRHQLWLPTLWGTIIILLFISTLTLFVFRNIAFFLAQEHPIKGQYLVVEGWISEPALLSAFKQYKLDGYQKLITTGGPITHQINPEHLNYAAKASAFFLSQGLPSSELVTIPTPESAQDRTYLSAVMVRDWFVELGDSHITFDLYSSDVHARRSFQLYNKAFSSKATIGVFSAAPTDFTLKHWWKTSAGAKTILAETAGLIWINCCFSPGAYGSHQEKWGDY